MATYHAVVVGKKGSSEELKLVERPLTPPQPNEVRIKLSYTGVSFGNLLSADMASNRPDPKKPLVLGYEIVGQIDAVGAAVTGWQPGDAVACYTGGNGGYTQYAYRQPEELVAIPAGVDGAAVVCLLLNYMTAYQCLFRVAKVERGATVLITGASGGVGSALLDVGRWAGLTMYGTASRSKHQLLLDKGATPIDYKSEDFVQVIKQQHPGGIDAAIDGIGGGSEVQCLAVVKRGGRVVSYGMRSINASGRFNFVPILLGFAQFSLLGLLPNGKRTFMYLIDSYKRSHPAEFKPDLELLLDLLARGEIQPIIGAVLPLSDAQRAHAMLAEGRVHGKIILDCTR